MSETEIKVNFETALEVLKKVCQANENHPGYIANTIRKMFDEKEFTLQQWQQMAEASDKTKKWAAQQWAFNQEE